MGKIHHIRHRAVRWWIGLFLTVLLCACTATPGSQASATPAATDTLRPPEITILPLATSDLSTGATATESAPTLAVETSTDAPGAKSTPVPSPKAQATQTPTEAASAAATTVPDAASTPTATPADGTGSDAASTPTATPTSGTGSDAQAQPAADQAGGCIDKAAYYGDITFPDVSSFQQNTAFTKTWQVRNVGTCVWNGYRLVYAGGDILNGKLANPMPVVRPGDTATISVDLKSPPQGGLFTSSWEFENPAGKRFGVNSGGGDLIWAKISVTWITPEAPGVPVTGPASSTTCTPQPNADYVQQVLALINQVRAQAGLHALTLRSGLSVAAMGHSVDMACKNYVDHTGSDGSTWYTRIKAQKYVYSYASENIFYGDPQFQGDPQSAMKWWMGSKIHHDNILNPKVTSIGIGYAFWSDSDYKGYYTLNFARP